MRRMVFRKYRLHFCSFGVRYKYECRFKIVSYSNLTVILMRDYMYIPT